MPFKCNLNAIEQLADRSELEMARESCSKEFYTLLTDENYRILHCSERALSIRINKRIDDLHDIMNSKTLKDVSDALACGKRSAAHLDTRRNAWALFSNFHRGIYIVYLVIPGTEKYNSVDDYLLKVSKYLELSSGFVSVDGYDLSALLEERKKRLMLLSGLGNIRRSNDTTVFDLARMSELLCGVARPCLSPYGISLTLEYDGIYPIHFATRDYASIFAAAVNLMIVRTEDKRINVSITESDSGNALVCFKTVSSDKTDAVIYAEFLCGVCSMLGFSTKTYTGKHGVYGFCVEFEIEKNVDDFARTEPRTRGLYETELFRDDFTTLLLGRDMFLL